MSRNVDSDVIELCRLVVRGGNGAMRLLQAVLALVVGVSAAVLPAPAMAASAYSLQYSLSADRSAPLNLDGATVTGSISVFVSPAAGIQQVRFYLDNTTATGSPRQTESIAPYDLAGTAAAGTANLFNTAGISAGVHIVTAAVDKTAGGTDLITASFTVAGSTPTYSLLLSKVSDRSGATALAGAALSGFAYVFVGPAVGISRVRFFLDNTTGTGSPRQTEAVSPYDFAGTAGSGAANAWDTSNLPAGPHTVTAAVDKVAGGTDLLTAPFTVSLTPAALVATPGSITLSATAGGSAVTATASLAATGGSTPSFAVGTNQPWLSASPATGVAPTALTLTANPSALTAGVFTATATVTATGFAPATITVTFNVTSAGTCAPVECSQIKVARPYQLTFSESAGGIIDGGGVGTGFTTYLRTRSGGGYVPAALAVDPLGKGLVVSTTAGGVNTTENLQDNMLGVGFDGTTSTVIEADLPSLPQVSRQL